MKITVYELLGLVKDSKAPRKIKHNDKIWRLASDGTYFIGSDYGYDFWVEHGDDKFEDESITLNDEVEILEEEKKTIDCLNLSLEEIEAFQEASQIFLKLNNEEDKQTFIKLLLGEGTYERWIDYLKSKGDK